MAPSLEIAYKGLKEKVETYLDSNESHKAAFEQLLVAQDTTFEKVLIRYLRSRNNSVSKAFDKLIETLEWRVEFNIKDLTDESVKAVKQLKGSYVCGLSREGDSICYIVPGAYNPNSAQDRIRFLVHLVEEGCRQSLTKKMIWVMDFGEFGNRASDPDSKTVAFQALKILQNHYPETLRSLFVVDAPWYFRGLWFIVKPFVDSVTKKKIQFISSSETQKILDQVPKEMLDVKFGGALEVTDEMKVNWSWIDEKLREESWQELKKKIREEDLRSIDESESLDS